MPRGSYAKVSAADRVRIVECADGGGDWKALCANLRVNPQNGSRMGQKWCSRAETPRWWPAQGSYGRAGGCHLRNDWGGSVNNTESVKGKDFGGLPIERCDFNDPQLPGRTIAYVEEEHCGRCKKQGPARGICASNQCLICRTTRLDGRNKH